MILAVDLKKAAEMTSLSKQTLRRLVLSKKINASKVGDRLLIPVSELQRICKPGGILKLE